MSSMETGFGLFVCSKSLHKFTAGQPLNDADQQTKKAHLTVTRS